MIAIDHIVSSELGGRLQFLGHRPKEQAFTFVFGYFEPPRRPNRHGSSVDASSNSPKLPRP